MRIVKRVLVTLALLAGLAYMGDAVWGAATVTTPPTAPHSSGYPAPGQGGVSLPPLPAASVTDTVPQPTVPVYPTTTVCRWGADAYGECRQAPPFTPPGYPVGPNF